MNTRDKLKLMDQVKAANEQHVKDWKQSCPEKVACDDCTDKGHCPEYQSGAACVADRIVDDGPIKPDLLPKKENPGYVCRVCGERYTAADLKELREMGEAYHREKGCFFCPDCWDDFQRLPLERQAEILINDGTGKV